LQKVRDNLQETENKLKKYGELYRKEKQANEATANTVMKLIEQMTEQKENINNNPEEYLEEDMTITSINRLEKDLKQKEIELQVISLNNKI